MLKEIQMKICSRCGKEKEDRGFHGLRCGPCRREVWEINAAERGDSREALNHRRLRLNMTEVEYKERLEQQGHTCAICRTPEKRKGKFGAKKLAIDHCHETGKIRGLLCSDCNVALGFLKDSPERIQSALDYILAGGVSFST